MWQIIDILRVVALRCAVSYIIIHKQWRCYFRRKSIVPQESLQRFRVQHSQENILAALMGINFCKILFCYFIIMPFYLVFPSETIQPLFDMANPDSEIFRSLDQQMKTSGRVTHPFLETKRPLQITQFVRPSYSSLSAFSYWSTFMKRIDLTDKSYKS